MSEDLELSLEMAKDAMDKALEHLGKELSKITTGKANPAMVSGLMVDYYGSPTPISQVANVGTSDARTITIQPWEKTMLSAIERSIFEANLGVTPMNDGEIVRIPIPPLTGDRRKALVKQTKALGEDARVGLRGARQKAMNAIKAEVKDGYPEDAGKKREAEVQSLTDAYSKRVDDYLNAKEKDIMKV